MISPPLPQQPPGCTTQTARQILPPLVWANGSRYCGIFGIEVFDKYVTEAALNIKLGLNITSLCSHITYRVLTAQHGFQSNSQQSEHQMVTETWRNISSNKQPQLLYNLV